MYTDNYQWSIDEDYVISYLPKITLTKFTRGFDIKIKNGTYLFLRHSNYKIF